VQKLLVFSFCLANQPICNQKRSGVANKNRCSANNAGNKCDAPRITPKDSRQQREHHRGAEFGKNDVPRRKRNDSPNAFGAVLSPMNPAGHFFVIRNIDGTEQSDH